VDITTVKIAVVGV